MSMNIIRAANLSDGTQKTGTKAISADANVKLVNYSVPVAVDHQIIFPIDVSQVRAIHIQSDGALTLQTNDGTTPDDTLNLVADLPYQWCTADYNALLLTVDVVDIFVTNATSAAVSLTILVEYDATP